MFNRLVPSRMAASTSSIWLLLMLWKMVPLAVLRIVLVMLEPTFMVMASKIPSFLLRQPALSLALECDMIAGMKVVWHVLMVMASRFA